MFDRCAQAGKLVPISKRSLKSRRMKIASKEWNSNYTLTHSKIIGACRNSSREVKLSKLTPADTKANAELCMGELSLFLFFFSLFQKNFPSCPETLFWVRKRASVKLAIHLSQTYGHFCHCPQCHRETCFTKGTLLN